MRRIIQFMMMLAGMEADFKMIREAKKPLILLSILTFLIPAISGFLIYQYFKTDDFPGKLLYASLFASHSVGIVFPVIRELKLTNSRFGAAVLISTVITDIASIILLAVSVQLKKIEGTVVLDNVRKTLSIFDYIDYDYVVYRWLACDATDKQWFVIQDWGLSDVCTWTPEKWGNYIIQVEARDYWDITQSATASTSVEYHPYIKGKCQMPYTGEGGGYLIGFETYDNPNGEYRYEMQILDCTLLAQEKDAWIYTRLVILRIQKLLNFALRIFVRR